MNVVDIPQPCARELYDEAVSRYASMVKSRAIGVHLLAQVTQPGLSDIDLLVVTDHVGVDNRFFFSALQRLPSRYHRLFRHEPYILPAWSLRVMQFTPHACPPIAGGRDVLQPYTSNDSRDERWCRMLEAYCSFASFHAGAAQTQMLAGRDIMGAAGAFRYALEHAAIVLPEAADESYAGKIAELRQSFFEQGADAAQRVRAAWDLFSAAFARLDAAMRRRLDASTTAEAVVHARKRLSGEEECTDLDREYAFRRARDIDGYNQEVASLGFPFGHLFPAAAYPGAVRKVPPMPLVDSLVHNVYRVRRRLTEYAAGA